MARAKRLSPGSALNASGSASSPTSGSKTMTSIATPSLPGKGSPTSSEKASADFIDEAALRERQARFELLDQVAKFCGLKIDRTGVTDTTNGIGIINPPYHASVRAPINLALPWHNSAIEVADRNHKIVMGRLSKSQKSSTPQT